MLLYEEICARLLDQIRRGALAPGERVPSEMELAGEFGVSRITSKRALEVLREAGLVERVRGKGTFVVRQLPDLSEVTVPLRGRVAAPRREVRTVALVVPDVSDSYGLELMCAIEERCADHEANLIVRRTHGQQAEEEKAVDSLVATGEVDGLIVFPVHGDFYNASLLRQVLDGYPVVLVDRHLAGIPVAAVHTDNGAAARALTLQLLAQGHEEIVFVSPPAVNTSSIEERLEGFRSAFQGRGRAHELTDLRSTLPGSMESVQGDIDAIRSFRDQHPEVTAYFACEYNLARMTDRALEGSRVVACFDSPGDSIGGPPYLHVQQNQAEMGRTAVDLLMARLRGETVPNLTYVPFEIVEAE